MKLVAGVICPLPGDGVAASGGVKRRIPLDAHEIASSKVFSLKNRYLLAPTASAQIRGMSLKPFCNHAKYAVSRGLPTDISTAFVDNIMTPADPLAGP